MTDNITPEDMQTRPWEPSEQLGDAESAAIYLSMIAEHNNPELLITAIGDVVRGQGMSNIAEKADIARSTLYQQFSAAGNPTLRKLLPLLDVLGLEIRFVAKHTDNPAASEGIVAKRAETEPTH